MGSPYTSRVSLLEDSPRRDRENSLTGKNGLSKHLQLRLWSMETVSTFVRIHGDEYLQKFLNVSYCFLKCFAMKSRPTFCVSVYYARLSFVGIGYDLSCWHIRRT